MIYPRLKLKSEVFANVLDGKQTEFKIENEDDPEQMLEQEMQGGDDEKKRQMSKEAKLIEKAMSFDEQRKFQQTNIQDFFFSSSGNGGSTAVSNEPSLMISDSQLNSTQMQPCDNLNPNQGLIQDIENDELDHERPPTPPLASENINRFESDDKFDCEAEDWNDGTDAKWRTY